MEIAYEQRGAALTVRPSGRLDTLTAPELEAFLRDLPGDVRALRFDLSELEYISSAGLRVLLAAHKKTNGETTVANANELCREIFDITGFSDVFRFE